MADVYTRWFLLEGDFFEEIIEAIYGLCVTSGDFVVDVGANHGRHTFPMAQLVGRRGRVIAIEALPHLAKSLAKSVKHLPQVRVINKAATATPGFIEFNWVRKDEGFSGIRRRQMPAELVEDVAIIRVASSTIDRCVAARWWMRRRRVTFIKMDIEGGELDALRGTKTILDRDRPIVVFENGGQAAANVYGYRDTDLFEFFAGRGYELFDLFGRPLHIGLSNYIDVPWYAIAVPYGDRRGAALIAQLPGLIRRLETGFRDRTALSRCLTP